MSRLEEITHDHYSKKKLAQKLMVYLLHRITSNDLVDWAELVMMDAEFEDQHFELIREIILRLGVGGVRSFGMTYEDYEEFHIFKLLSV